MEQAPEVEYVHEEAEEEFAHEEPEDEHEGYEHEGYEDRPEALDDEEQGGWE